MSGLCDDSHLQCYVIPLNIIKTIPNQACITVFKLSPITLYHPYLSPFFACVFLTWTYYIKYVWYHTRVCVFQSSFLVKAALILNTSCSIPINSEKAQLTWLMTEFMKEVATWGSSIRRLWINSWRTVEGQGSESYKLLIIYSSDKQERKFWKMLYHTIFKARGVDLICHRSWL